MSKKIILIGLIIVFIYFIIHLAIINDYGLSWDFHAHFYSGLYHLGLAYEKIKTYLPPAASTMVDYGSIKNLNSPYGPFISIIPTLSFILFYEKLHIFPFDSAYNFPSVILGVLGVGVLFLFMAESIDLTAALWGAIFLALMPNYFGYLHYNMKDIPNAVAFALGIYLFYRLVKKERWINLFAAVLSFSLAFNIKINSFAIPIINFIWWFWVKAKEAFKKKRGLAVLYFILAPMGAVVLWWPFWTDPLGKLMEIPKFFSANTVLAPVLFFGTTYRSGINIPWYYPYLYIGITTPIPILVSFIFGLILSIKKIKTNIVYVLLLLWFFVPLLRFFIPNVSTLDGVRHFIEVLFPLSAIAGVGGSAIYQYVNKIDRSKILGLFLVSISIVSLTYDVLHLHPYQTSYFNSLVGGIKGANGKFDVDFWGMPQKSAMLWLNKNAPPNASISIPMAGDTAGVYLRHDLYKNVTFMDISQSDYTVVLNRQTFLDLYQLYHLKDFISQKTAGNKVIYKVAIDGVPLVWVIKN